MHATPATDADVRTLLACFVAPRRADLLAAELLAAGGSTSALPAAVAVLRDRFGVADDELLLALAEAGVPVASAARLVGTDVVAVNRLLDAEATAPVVPQEGPAVPRGLEVAGRVVRVGWIVVALAVAVVLVQARGGLLPCRAALCVGSVEVLRTDATTVPAGDVGVIDARDVRGVLFHHRTGDGPWRGTAVWRVDGQDLLVEPVTIEGPGVLEVEAPVGPLPPGVHVVELRDGPPGAAAVLTVSRGD